MMRTTVTLPEELVSLLQREARRTDASVSEVVRRALSQHLGACGAPRRLGFAALGRSGRRHTARDADRILRREWSGARRR
jgi:Arc/MetJ-type ribon-helix-helix transcriptional regulator